jgi:hypothetical protein
MTWQADLFLVASSAFLCAALVLSGLAVFHHPKSPLKRLSNFIKRKKRERRETYWLMTQGAHLRQEEGVPKTYRAGGLIGLNERELENEAERVEKYGGTPRIIGPIDVKAWKRFNKNEEKEP